MTKIDAASNPNAYEPQSLRAAGIDEDGELALTPAYPSKRATKCQTERKIADDPRRTIANSHLLSVIGGSCASIS
jgi:hypothetical protein